MRTLAIWALVVAVLAVVAAPVFAEEGGGRRGEWLRQRRAGGEGENPFRRGKAEEGDQQARRPGKHPMMKAAWRRFLMSKPEAKAEMARFQEAMKEHHLKGRKIREAIRSDIQNGKTPLEAFEAHEAELLALAKEGVMLHVKHTENLAAISEKYADEFARTLVAKMKERIQKHRRRGEGEGAAKPEGEGEGDRRPPRRPAFRRFGRERRGGADTEMAPVE
jgi:hypothetical protein